MRKINLSNDTKRDAEVAFGTTFHRPTPVYKTADGKKSVNERRVRATMKTTDAALQFSITPSKGSDIFALTLNGIGVSCANIPAGYHLPHKDDEYTVIAELEHALAFIRHFVTTEHRRFPHTYKTYTQQMIEG